MSGHIFLLQTSMVPNRCIQKEKRDMGILLRRKIPFSNHGKQRKLMSVSRKFLSVPDVQYLGSEHRFSGTEKKWEFLLAFYVWRLYQTY